VGRRSRQVMLAELNEIRRMVADRKRDPEIAAALNISQRGLYKLKERIYEQDKEEWDSKARESLESRALKIIETLDDCYHINKAIAENPDKQDKDRIEASQVMVQAQINMFQLLKQGPTIKLQLPYRVVELPEKVEYPRANSV